MTTAVTAETVVYGTHPTPSCVCGKYDTRAHIFFFVEHLPYLPRGTLPGSPEIMEILYQVNFFMSLFLFDHHHSTISINRNITPYDVYLPVICCDANHVIIVFLWCTVAAAVMSIDSINSIPYGVCVCTKL